MPITSFTKKDGETLTIGDETNKGKIKFFHDFMGQIWVAFHETPQQFKADDVSKKGVGDGWVWTDELVGEYGEWYRNEQGKGWKYLGWDRIEAFKDFKGIKQSQPPKEESKREWEIVAYSSYLGVPCYVKNIRNNAYWSDCECKKSYIEIRDINNPSVKIHSVRRLSDGEVFSVGDEVVHKTDGEIKTAKILKFIVPQHEVFKNKMWFEWIEGKDFCKDLARFNKKSKPENKERIEVDVFQTNGTDCMNGMLAYTYTVSQKIPQEKFPQIKKVIEAVLNDETSKP